MSINFYIIPGDSANKTQVLESTTTSQSIAEIRSPLGSVFLFSPVSSGDMVLWWMDRVIRVVGKETWPGSSVTRSFGRFLQQPAVEKEQVLLSLNLL